MVLVRSSEAATIMCVAAAGKGMAVHMPTFIAAT